MRSTSIDPAAAPALAKHIEHWPISRLIPYARNARTHSDVQIAQIAASIREFGFTNPILVDTGDGIIAGHGRLLAARLLQLETVPVIVLDHLSETQKRAYIIADNKLAENAGWDDASLQVELAELQIAGFDRDLVGFDDKELTRLLALNTSEGLTDEDAVPEITETPVTIPGDLWILGYHRVLCGDATSASDIARLMDGDTADLVFTDPPYNVDYQGYTEERLTIQNDKMTPEQFQQFLQSTFRSYREVVKKGASLYVCHSSSMQREFQDAMETAGFEIRCQIIWAKNTFAWDSVVTSFSTSRSSTAMSPERRTPGTAISRNRLFGRRRSPRRTDCIRRRSGLNWSDELSSIAVRRAISSWTFSVAPAPR